MYKIVILILFFVLYFLLKKKKENFKNRELFFIHIPKNAGSTIEQIFNKKNIHFGRFYFKKKKKNSSPLWHIPPSNPIVSKHYKNKINFCIVRNPYERIISEFTYLKKIQKQNKDLNKEDLNNFIKKSLKKYEKNNNYKDCHFIPQVKYIYGEPKCHEILRLETLDYDFDKLLKKYNYPEIKLIKDNTSNSKRFNVKDLDKESIKIINKIYKNDFEKLKYKMINP